MRTTNPYKPHPDASALTAARVIDNGVRLRTYTVVEPDTGWQAIEHVMRTAWFVGYISEADGSEYAVLSVLDDDNTELQEFGVPSAAAFRWWYRRLSLRVTNL